VPCAVKCPICGSYQENEWHCFFGCLAAQEVWRETSIWKPINDYISNAVGIVPMMFKIMEEINATNLAPLLCWYGIFGGGGTKNVGMRNYQQSMR
jgi:hypothetical protein